MALPEFKHNVWFGTFWSSVDPRTIIKRVKVTISAHGNETKLPDTRSTPFLLTRRLLCVDHAGVICSHMPCFTPEGSRKQFVPHVPVKIGICRHLDQFRDRQSFTRWENAGVELQHPFFQP